jgi:methanogenic corrinoid protein MtbC1
VSSPSDSSPGDPGSFDLGIQAALLDGDAGLAYRLVSDLMAQGVSFDKVLFDVLAPLQRDVGTRWLQADYRIAEEHAASAAVETVVALLAGSFDMPADATHVVVACAEGDDHSLPARMVAAYLSYLGWRVTFLGGTLPALDLGAFLADEPPTALVLSCAATPNLPGARASIAAAHAAGVPVVAGGRAFGHDASRALAVGADRWLADPRELESLFAGWSPDIESSEATALRSPEAAALSETLPGLIAAASAGNPGDVSPASLRADLQLLGKTLIAAVLVDDSLIIEEFVAWHRTRFGAHDDVIPTNDLIDLMTVHLPDASPQARAMLAPLASG